jgi:hypothetical protein
MSVFRKKDDNRGRYQTCHIILTNADGLPSGRLEGFSAADFQKAVDLNLMSTINPSLADKA